MANAPKLIERAFPLNQVALAFAPHRVEVPLPFQLSAEPPQPLLPLESHHEAQRGFDRLALAHHSRGAHRLLHQLVVDYDGNPHNLIVMSMLVPLPYTSPTERAGASYLSLLSGEVAHWYEPAR